MIQLARTIGSSIVASVPTASILILAHKYVEEVEGVVVMAGIALIGTLVAVFISEISSIARFWNQLRSRGNGGVPLESPTARLDVFSAEELLR